MTYAHTRALVAILTLALPAVIAARTPAGEEQELSHKDAPVPTNAVGIWKAIDGHVKELEELVATGNLKQVHEHAFAIRDLVRALPEHSAALAAEARTRVSANVKFVDTLAARLDESGDANDKTATASNLKKLEDVLARIRVEYPKA